MAYRSHTEVNHSSQAVTATGSTAARSLAARFADVVNVKDFGAVGDGSTDDSTAIQTCLTAALTGGTVYVPPGTYLVNAATYGLVLNGASRLQGAGRNRTVLRRTIAGPVVKVNDGTQNSVENHGWSIADLSILGSGASTTVGLEVGAPGGLLVSAGGTVERVTISGSDTGLTTAGINILAGQLVTMREVWSWHNAGDGLQMTGTTTENQGVNLHDCRFRNNVRGMYVTQAGAFSLTGCDFESNTEEGALFYANNDAGERLNVTLSQCYFDTNNTSRDKATNPAQLRFDGNMGNTTGWVATKIIGARFNGRGAGDRAVYFWRGDYDVIDPVAINPQVGSFDNLSSTLVVIHGRSSRTSYGPAQLWGGVVFGDAQIFWTHAGQAAAEALPYGWGVWGSNINGRGDSTLLKALEVVAADPNGASLTRGAHVLVRNAISTTRKVPTYGTTITIANLLANEFVITPTDGVAFTVSNPADLLAGQRISIRLVNSTGGALGAVTWDTKYKLAAWTSPATGYSRAIDFQCDGTNWIEVSRTPADVPN